MTSPPRKLICFNNDLAMVFRTVAEVRQNRPQGVRVPPLLPRVHLSCKKKWRSRKKGSMELALWASPGPGSREVGLLGRVPHQNYLINTL